MPSDLRFAICQEIFGQDPIEAAARKAAQLGYQGLELAPHLLAEDATQISAERRRSVRDTIRDAGLSFVGLHWLLFSPPGLHITSSEPKTRRFSWDYVRRSIDLSSDLSCGEPSTVVIGSPKQRSTRGELAVTDALEILADELGALSEHADARNVTLILEPVPASQTDVVNTTAEAVAVIDAVDSPAVETMFDVHNGTDETEPHPDLIRRYASRLAHIHVNELDGQEPGRGNYHFAALLAALDEVEYDRWISVESFDFSRPGEEIAARALTHLQSCFAY